jgi:hypothetical protein
MIRAAVVAGAALLAAAFPLALYTLSLAAFGLVHVLFELRYVDARFSPRVPRGALAAISFLLLATALERTLGFAGLLPPRTAAVVELALLAGLIGAVLPHLRRFAPLGVAALGLVVGALLYAPLAALPLLALLHNLTPVGFLAEALPPARRRRAMALCALVFLAVPAAVALLSLRLEGGGWDPLGAGPLGDHLRAFVPASTPGAAAIFSAAVYLQVMHYAAVVYLLPPLAPEWRPAAALLPWPRPTLFHRGAAALAALLFVAFALSFRDARAFYGIAASVHAWVEIPLLLIAPTLVRSRG